jgi:putative phage-type endonuclease
MATEVLESLEVVEQPMAADYLAKELAHRKALLGDRTTYIGGSDIAKLVGVSDYGTPVTVVAEKIGRLIPEDPSDKDAVIAGIIKEPLLAREYARRKGVSVRRYNQTLRHPEYPFLAANVDRLIVGVPDKGLEVKVAGLGAALKKDEYDELVWGPDGTDRVPDAYAIQCQWYMFIASAYFGRPFTSWDLFAEVGGTDFRTYPIPADPELQRHLAERAIYYWTTFVSAKELPSATTEADARMKWPQARVGSAVEASDEILDIVRVERKVSRELDELKGTHELLRARIIDYIADNETLTRDGKPIATLKGRRAFDQLAFNSAHPDVYKKFEISTVDKDALKKAEAKLYDSFMKPSTTRVLNVALKEK